MNLPNLISLLRVPLALALFVPDAKFRLWILFIAILTDGLDGFLARKLSLKTRLGAILDPLTDKFFVLVALYICFSENPLPLWQVAAFFSRDIALFFLTASAFFKGPLHRHPVRSVWPGKLSTALQFVILALLVEGVYIPPVIWLFFVLLSLLFLIELIKKFRPLARRSR